MSRPLPSSFDGNDDFYNEKAFAKVMRRLKEEPLVPIGCILTVAAFTNAYRAMRRGDHNGVQRMFRARVAAQAFTVIAMVAGGMYYSADRHKQKELWKLQQEQEAEEKRIKWIKELEVRDAEDQALKDKLERRRQKSLNRAAPGAGTESIAAQAMALKDAKNTQDEAVADQNAEGEKKGEGVLGSLGGWLGSSKKAPQDPVQDQKSSTKEGE